MEIFHMTKSLEIVRTKYDLAKFTKESCLSLIFESGKRIVNL